MLYSNQDTRTSNTVAYAGPRATYINKEALKRLNSNHEVPGCLRSMISDEIDVFAGEARPKDAPRNYSVSAYDSILATDLGSNPNANLSHNIAVLLKKNPGPDALDKGLDHMQRELERYAILKKESKAEYNALIEEEAYLADLASRN